MASPFLKRGIRTVGAALVVSMLGALAGGCAWMRIGGIEEAPQRPQQREMSRLQLLQMIQEDMDVFGCMKSKARIEVTWQDRLVAASDKDEVRRRLGKSYRKTFLRFDVNGYLAFTRWPGELRKVRFQGAVTGANANFTMLGLGDEFWISMPNASRGEDRRAPRGYTLHGTVSPEAARPKDRMSVRPQDLADLMLFDEVYLALYPNQTPAGSAKLSGLLCFRETWNDAYVLTFIHPDRPEMIVSRIWVERKEFRVLMHQLYDSDGAIYAEARFGAYKPYPSKRTAHQVYVPTEITFLWPRDSLVMDVVLSGVEVNGDMSESLWQYKPEPGYELRPFEAPLKEDLPGR